MDIALTNTTFPIVNPHAPMAYMSLKAGVTFNVASYMMVGSLGAFIWDLFANIHDEYRLLFQYRMSFPALVYFFSRLIVLTGIIVDTIFWSAPLGVRSCQNFLITACVLYHVAFSSTTFLFFLRVRAIFNRNKYVITVFSVLWLGVVGASMAVAMSGVAGVIGPTKYCKPGSTKPYIAASPITLLINDTCVFLAISWRLLSSSWDASDEGESPSVLRFLRGHNLPIFTRVLVQDGQIYYLISVLTNVFSVIMATVPAISLGFGHTYVLSAVMMNMMASRVYRRTKFGKFREDQISTTFIETRGKSEQNSDSTSKWEDESRRSGDDPKRKWYEVWRSRVLLALILVSLATVPAVCALVCSTRRNSKKM